MARKSPKSGPAIALATPESRWPKSTKPAVLEGASGFERFEIASNAKRIAKTLSSVFPRITSFLLLPRLDVAAVLPLPRLDVAAVLATRRGALDPVPSGLEGSLGLHARRLSALGLRRRAAERHRHQRV